MQWVKKERPDGNLNPGPWLAAGADCGISGIPDSALRQARMIGRYTIGAIRVQLARTANKYFKLLIWDDAGQQIISTDS